MRLFKKYLIVIVGSFTALSINAQTNSQQNCLQFKGKDNFVDITDNIPVMEGFAEYTLEFDFKADFTNFQSSQVFMLSSGDRGETDDKKFTISLIQQSANTAKIHIYSDNDYVYESVGTVDDGSCYRITVRRSIVNGQDRAGHVFVDGALFANSVNSPYGTGSFQYFPNAGEDFFVNLTMGCRFFNGNPTDFYSGVIDNFIFYETAMSNSYIASNYYLTPNIQNPAPGLVSFTSFNQGSAGQNNSGINELYDDLSGMPFPLVDFDLVGPESNFISSPCSLLPPPDNTDCGTSLLSCIQDSTIRVNFDDDGITLYYLVYNDPSYANQFSVNFSTSVNINVNIGLYGHGVQDPIDPCEIENQGVLVDSYSGNGNTQVNLYSSTSMIQHVLKIEIPSGISAGFIEFFLLSNPFHPQGLTCDFSPIRNDCETCLPTFSPTPGKYVVSAWVSEGNYQGNDVSFSNPSIKISYNGVSETEQLLATGNIIEGWQKIEQVIEIPPGAIEIIIELDCNSGDCYFDDLRFYPTDGSMLSYVYDTRTLRLVAELDERNYSTIYEYNEEGKLTRIKKETEKGIMTIQENRESIQKTQ